MCWSKLLLECWMNHWIVWLWNHNPQQKLSHKTYSIFFQPIFPTIKIDQSTIINCRLQPKDVHKYIAICSYSHTLELLYNNVAAQTALVVFNQSATTLFPDFQKQALHKEDFIKVTNKTTERQQYLNTLTWIVVLMPFATHMISPSPNRCCYTNPKEVTQTNHWQKEQRGKQRNGSMELKFEEHDLSRTWHNFFCLATALYCSFPKKVRGANVSFFEWSPLE